MKHAKKLACAFCITLCFFAFYRIYQVKFPFDIVLPWILYFPMLGMAAGPLFPQKWMRHALLPWATVFLLSLFLAGTFFNQNVSLHVFVSRQYYPYPPPPDFYARVALIILSFFSSVCLFGIFSAFCFHEHVAEKRGKSASAVVLCVLAGYLASTFAILHFGPYAVLLAGMAGLTLLVMTQKKAALAAGLAVCISVGVFSSRQKDVFLLWRAGYNYKLLDTTWTPYYYLNFISFNEDRCLGGVYNYLMLWQVCKNTDLIEKELKFFHSEIGKGKTSALVIGRAEGTTFITLDYPKPHLKRGTAVEIDPAVPERVSGKFSAFSQDVYKKPGFRAVAMDWRAFLKKDTQKYDVAVWDGLGIRLFVEPFTNFFQEDYLYTKESLALLFEERLTGNGIFAGNWGSTQENEIYPLLANLPKGVHKIAFWTTFNDYPLMGLPVLLFAASRDKKRLDEIAGVLREIKPFRQIPTDINLMRYQFTDDKPFLQKFIQPPLFVVTLPLLFIPLYAAWLAVKRERRKSAEKARREKLFFIFGILCGLLFTLFMSRCSRFASDGGAAQGFVMLMTTFLASASAAFLVSARAEKNGTISLSALCLAAGSGMSGFFSQKEFIFLLACVFGFFIAFMFRAMNPLPSRVEEHENGGGACAGLGLLAGNLLAQILPWVLGYRLSGVMVAFLWFTLYAMLFSSSSQRAQIS